MFLSSSNRSGRARCADDKRDSRVLDGPSGKWWFCPSPWLYWGNHHIHLFVRSHVIIDPRWSAPCFVSLCQKNNHADTLGFTHMHTMQGQTPEGNLRHMLLYSPHMVRIQGIYTHFYISLSFRALICHLLMWWGHWSVAHPEEAHYDSHLSALGRPGIDLSKVSVVLLLL